MKCYSELVEALENNALPYRTVARRVGSFSKDVCQPVKSNIQGLPVCVRNDLAHVVFKQLMNEDRRSTLLDLEWPSGIEKRTIHSILRNELHIRKIAAWWVPHALTKVQQWLLYAIYFDHLARLTAINSCHE
ncbi:uncharacterized protein TNCV_1696871 [Trichonephila clavipes]|nr:uncharacterized protein TNCV_1696871 [Trichonephila clavipes]